MAAGNRFESYAEGLFEGQKLGFKDYQGYLGLTKQTAQALLKPNTIFQGRFEYDGLTCICDVITKQADQSLDLYEIKAGSRLKAEYLDDLAFQAVVLAGSGYQLNRIYLIHVNGKYQRQGEIDVNQLTQLVDVSRQVKQRLAQTRVQLKTAKQVLAESKPPDTQPIHAASTHFGEWLKIYQSLKPPAAGSLLELGAIGQKQLLAWLKAGKQQLKALELADEHLKPKQVWQLEAQRAGKPLIDKTALRQFLAQLEFPLYFLDYETMASVIPYFDGHQPWQQYPFQYSLHRLDSPEAQLQHTAYLHTEKSEPSLALSQQLKTEIGRQGTILAWYMPFEKSCNQVMARLQPTYQDFYQQINDRIADLMTPFARGWYKDHRFGASASIKNVLPVLVPKLSYKQLTISDGANAQHRWMATFLDDQQTQTKQEIEQQLLSYCQLDTLAMVEIYRVLRASS